MLNLAVRDFLMALSELDPEDYTSFGVSLPEIIITAPEELPLVEESAEEIKFDFEQDPSDGDVSDGEGQSLSDIFSASLSLTSETEAQSQPDLI